MIVENLVKVLTDSSNRTFMELKSHAQEPLYYRPTF